MKKMIFYLIILSVFTKIAGFLKEIVLSYFYGVSAISDAYILSLTIPGFVFTFVGVAITTSYIPIYMKCKNKDNSVDVINYFTSNLMNLTLILSIIIYIVAYVFMEPIVKVFALGFSDEIFMMAVNYSRINIAGILFLGEIYILNGFYQSNNNFILPNIVVLIFNILAAVFIFISSFREPKIMVWGNVIALSVQFIVLIAFLNRYRFEYKKVVDPRQESFRSVIKMSIPLIISTSVVQINVLIDRTLATTVTIGGISALNYANKLNMFIQGTIVLGITTVIFPKMSKYVVENEFKKLEDLVGKSLFFTIFLLTPATVGALVFSNEIVDLLFKRGAFDQVAVTMTAGVLFMYSFGMVFIGIREIVTRCFYSFGDTRKPAINGIVGVILNIILNLFLSKLFGLKGLAIATSISIIFSTVILVIISRGLPINIFGYFKVKKLYTIFVSATIMGVLSKPFYTKMLAFFSEDISLLISIFSGIIVYFCLMLFMNFQESVSILKKYFNFSS